MPCDARLLNGSDISVAYHGSMRPMGGSFLYSQVADEDTLVVDPDVPPQATTQGQLRHEVERFQAYFDMDLYFCRAVEGVSQESNLWVARNSDASGLSDVDLQRFKNIAWNECVVKRFLPTQEGSVTDVGRSMLQIVRNLNLQWRGFEVMGLHPKVEAAEKQIVMLCMEKRLLAHDLDVGRVARCLRRCPNFRDFFSNAVGCHIVAKTGHTPGLSKTQYNTDLDYVYKNQGLYFFESALKRNCGLVVDCIAEGSPLGVDYITRLCGLKLVSRGDVLLQNPPDKPGTPIVLRGERVVRAPTVVRDGEVNSEGIALTVRAMTRDMDAFREEFKTTTDSLGLPALRRKVAELTRMLVAVNAEQHAFILEMREFAGTMGRSHRRPRRSPSPPPRSPPRSPSHGSPSRSPSPGSASDGVLPVPPAVPGPAATVPAGAPGPVGTVPAGGLSSTLSPALYAPADPQGTVPPRADRGGRADHDRVVDDAMRVSTSSTDPAADMDSFIHRFAP